MRGNRFWEFYLVRYLLGTIFGIVILFYLIINYNNEISTVFFNKHYIELLADQGDSEDKISISVVENIKDEEKIRYNIYDLLFNTTYEVKNEEVNLLLNILNLPLDSSNNVESFSITHTGFSILASIVIAVSGFLYMYFSSMLILLFHGMRYMLFSLPEKSTHNAAKLFFCGFFLIIITILIFLFYADTNVLRHVLSILILLFLALIFLSVSPVIKKFYGALSKYRTKGESKFQLSSNKQLIKEATDYVESYKHLREHGNAFGIIVCEILFALWLIEWEFSFWSLFYWCLFGSIAWVLGTYLEVSKVNSINSI